LRLIDARVTETSVEQIVTLQAVLDRPATTAVSVAWSTWGVTASKGRDYAGAEGTLTIPTGASGGTIRLRILGDRSAEGTETVELRFSNLRNASFLADDSVLTVTIDDDDGLLSGVVGVVGGVLGGVTSLLGGGAPPPSAAAPQTASMSAQANEDPWSYFA
jgi:hypothetical protein